MLTTQAKAAVHTRPALLLVDDDPTFRAVLGTALERRGFEVLPAHGTRAAIELLDRRIPQYAVVDLKMPEISGLVLVEKLAALRPPVRTVMLTAYASIATAVEAIKLGAIHYLTKPADADEIVAAMMRDVGNTQVAVPERPISIARLEWEHLHKVLAECDGNISAAARRLGMHRRTLQRKLNKRPAKSEQ